MSKLAWIIASFLFSCCETYKILVVYPFPARSHNILGNGVVRHLLSAGHEVTYITPFPLKESLPKLRQIDASKTSMTGDAVNIQRIMNKEADLNDEVYQFDIINDVVKQTFRHENVQIFLSDPNEQFDIVVAEWMFNEVYAGLSALFQCPYVWVLPYEPSVVTLRLVDESPNPAYIPNLGSSNVAPYSFVQRVLELKSQLRSLYLKEFNFYFKEKETYENSYTKAAIKRGVVLPEFDDVRFNASMVLCNTHVSLGQPMRLPQNFKSIAGYFIESNVKPLPENLQSIMDNAKHGVIYFSMGSNLKSKELAEPIKQGLAKMFGELKQTIIWKFEEEFPNLPNNIHIVPWAPQQSILAHPNCKLFITHGGLLSTTETIHFGVPIIGIPVFIDQFNNVNLAVQKGYAKRVDISNALADNLRLAIQDILSDSKYSRRAKELSLIYHDRPVSPGRELVHWVEHVVRTRGASHLRSPSLHMPFYQKMYLDLAAELLIALFVIKRFLSMCFSRSKVRSSKKMD